MRNPSSEPAFQVKQPGHQVDSESDSDVGVILVYCKIIIDGPRFKFQMVS